nr:unnamed protein product [Leishmania braziliensis]
MSERVAFTTGQPPVPRARRPSPLLPLTTTLIALYVLFQLSAPAAAQSSDSDPYYDGIYYYYTLFVNGPGGGDSVDGPSGMGRYGVVGYGGAMVKDGVVFSDMGGSGSAIRLISRNGYISTIAGNLSRKGNNDGPSTEALFGGIASGDSRSNSLASGNGGYYVADTVNSALRFINTSTQTTTTILNASVLRTPNSLAISIIDDKTSVFLSNTGLHQVLYIPTLSSPVGQVNFTSDPFFVPGAITVLPELSRAFIVNATLQIYCWSYAQPGSTSWKVSDPRVADFGRILTTSSDGTKVLYVTSNGSTIASLSAIASPTASPALIPEKMIDFNTLVIGGRVQLFFERTPDSWYILTTTKFMIVSATPIQPEDSSSDSDEILSGRHQGLAAFPTEAFPINDSCLMAQAYHWMRMDATEAYNTTDYLSEFLIPPNNSTATLVYGDMNVSGWCGNITADLSNDHTILILTFWGPRGYTLQLTQDRLVTSTWTRTRAFLESLKNSGWNLGPFCFFNCTTTCKTITAPKCLVNTESACDDVCRGAIASSVVMAVAGIVLIILMIISPSNILAAVVMVPII